MSSPLSPESFAALSDIVALDVSTDGRHLASCTRRPNLETDDYDYSLVVYARSAAGQWERQTALDEDAAGARFSPDGQMLALTIPGPDGATIVVTTLDGRQRREVVTWPTQVEGLSWSPSGLRLGFVARVAPTRPGTQGGRVDTADGPMITRRLQYQWDTLGWLEGNPRHGYVVGVDDGSAPLNVTSSCYDDYDLAWYGDDAVMFVSRRHERRDLDRVTDLYVRRFCENAARKLTHSDLQWAVPVHDRTSGKIIARFARVADYPCHARLAQLDSDGYHELAPEHPWALDTGMPISGSSLSVTARGVVCEQPRQGSVQLVCVERSATDGAWPVVQLNADDRWTVSLVSACDACAVVAAAAPLAPVELYECGADGGWVQISDINTAFTAETQLAGVEWVRASARDGTALDCWVVAPDTPSAAAMPAVLYVQGGPAQFGWDFYPEFQMLASSGIAVIYGNPRGTTGYTEAWARCLCGPKAKFPGRGWGGTDLEDLVEIARAGLAADPQIDPDRLGVAGGSYGGILAALIGTEWDGVKAVIAERGVYDFSLMGGISDVGMYSFDELLGLDAVDDRAEFDAISPLLRAKDLTVPIMIIHSTNDLRCPIAMAEEYFSALRRRGRDATLVVFPGESHELSRSGRPTHRRQRLTIVRDWLLARLNGRLAEFEREHEHARPAS